MRFQRHSETSRKAAVSALDFADTQRAKVYRFIREQGARGATDEEMQIALEMNPSTQRPRRVELVDDLLVVHDGGKRRKTMSGREAVVWEVVSQQQEQRELFP
jgi:hypothetical protein